jgi:hypothetical protein
MKTHAFVRSNIPRTLKNGKNRIAQLNSKILGIHFIRAFNLDCFKFWLNKLKKLNLTHFYP